MPAPGSTVTTGLAATASHPDAPPSATTFIAAPIGFGPVGWRPYRALAEVLADYNAGHVFSSNVAGVILGYFLEGGDLLYLNRSVGPAAAAATVDLADRQDPDGLALTLTAATVGAWGNDLAVTIVDGAGDTVDVTVEFSTELAAVLGIGTTIVLAGLESPAAIAAAIAAHPILSGLIEATSVSTGTGALDLPAEVEGEAFTGGDDDLDTEAAAIAAWTPPADLGPGVVIAPSLADLAALEPEALYQFASDLIDRRRILFTGSNGGDTLEDAAADLETVADNLAAGTQAVLAGIDVGARAERIGALASAIGAFWPWIGTAPGGSAPAPTPAVGAVAARRSIVHTLEGPHRVPAGEAGIISGAVGVAIWPGGDPTGTITEEVAAEADAAGLNVIRTIGGTVRVYGYKPLQLPAEFSSVALHFPLLTSRDVLNAVAAEADVIAERYVFRPIDPRGHVFSDLRRDLLGVGERFAAAGSLYARVDPLTRAQIDPGYAVDTGPEVNTTESIAAGQIRANMRIRVTPSGPFVTITVTKTLLAQPL